MFYEPKKEKHLFFWYYSGSVLFCFKAVSVKPNRWWNPFISFFVLLQIVTRLTGPNPHHTVALLVQEARIHFWSSGIWYFFLLFCLIHFLWQKPHRPLGCCSTSIRGGRTSLTRKGVLLGVYYLWDWLKATGTPRNISFHFCKPSDQTVGGLSRNLQLGMMKAWEQLCPRGWSYEKGPCSNDPA